MQNIINFFTQFPASSYYHALAFLGTAFANQYSVQIVKLIAKNKLGKTTLRFLNGTFATLFTAAGALAAGGISIGTLTISAGALASFSALIYRIHNNVVYKNYSGAADDILNAAVPTEPTVIETPKFSENV